MDGDDEVPSYLCLRSPVAPFADSVPIQVYPDPVSQS